MSIDRGFGTRRGARGTGIMREGVEIKFRLGFNKNGIPVLGLYEEEGDVFIAQMTIESEEIVYFRDFFSQFGDR